LVKNDDREIPLFFAVTSIWCKISSGNVMLTRTVLDFKSGTDTTRKATAFKYSLPAIISSSLDGFGIFSPNYLITLIWPDKASNDKSLTSSIDLPPVIQPGKSGNETPKSLEESL
jgi:hypothetical protein